MTTGANSSSPKSTHDRPRSLPVNEWPDADQRAWEDACRPGSRLKPGGAASYLAEVSRDDFARRYGAFLGFLQRSGRLKREVAAAAQVTLANVEAYITDLTARVRSVTVWICIYKLRRAAELLTPASDFSWLAEIEKDLALEPAAALQEAEECSVPVGKIVATYLGEIARGASRLESGAGPAGVFPGPPIGIGPFADRKRPRTLTGGLAHRGIATGHHSAASNASSPKCSITILLKISLAWMFSKPM